MTLALNSHIKKHKHYLDHRINDLYDYVSSSTDTEIIPFLIKYLIGQNEIGNHEFTPAVLQSIEELKSLINRWDILNDGDIVGYIYEQIQSRKHKKFKGQFFTPEEVVDIIVAKSLQVIDKEEILVLDPACGSGQFLISAIKYLSVKLSLSIKEITSRFIHGMDIDPIAVMIARYNVSQISGCEIDAVNVHCGDFLTKDNLILTTSHQYRQPYDLIIGNPPWGSSLTDKKYYLENYFSAKTGINTFTLFIERAFDFINPSGVISFLIPEAFLNIKVHKNSRKIVLENACIRRIIICGEQFKGVFAPSITLTVQRENDEESRKRNIVEIHSLSESRNTAIMVPQSSFHATPENIFNINYTRKAVNIINTVMNSDCFYLKGNAKFFLGIVTGNNSLHISNEQTEEFPDPIIMGKDVHQYNISFSNHYFNYDKKKLQQVAPRHLYTTPNKVLYKFIGKRLTFALDTEGFYSLNNVNGFIPEYNFINIESTISILNSSVLQYYYEKNFFTIKVLRSDLERLPIKIMKKETQNKVKKLTRQVLASNDLSNSIARENIEDIIFHEYGINDKQAYYINEYLS